jgi:hypothetical protein
MANACGAFGIMDMLEIFLWNFVSCVYYLI